MANRSANAVWMLIRAADGLWFAPGSAARIEANTLLPRERVRLVFGRSVVMNGYRVEHGRFIVEGIGHERIAVLTHHDVRVAAPVHHYDARGHESWERRNMHEDRREHHGRF